MEGSPERKRANTALCGVCFFCWLQKHSKLAKESEIQLIIRSKLFEEHPFV